MRYTTHGLTAADAIEVAREAKTWHRARPVPDDIEFEDEEPQGECPGTPHRGHARPNEPCPLSDEDQ